MKSITKLLINIASLAVMMPFGYSLLGEVRSFDMGQSENTLFLAGTVVSGILCLLFARRLRFFMVFEHELTHNIWALLFLKKPRGFHVNPDGSGQFQFSGRTSTISELFISLGPYFFPTITVLLILASPIVKEGLMEIYFLAIGITYGYHLSSTVKETHLRQTDISENGYFTSFNLIISLNLLTNGLVLAFINGGWGCVGVYFLRSYEFAIFQAENFITLIGFGTFY